jgi:hypothetical protein
MERSHSVIPTEAEGSRGVLAAQEKTKVLNNALVEAHSPHELDPQRLATRRDSSA